MALTATVGGAVLGPGKGAGAFINAGRGAASRMGRAVLAGGASGAVYGAAEAEGDRIPIEGEAAGGLMDRVTGAAMGAAEGAVMGPVVERIGQGFTRAAQALSGTGTGQAALATLAGLRDEATGLHEAAEASGAVLDQPALSALAQGVFTALRREGYNPRLHPRVEAVLGELSDLVQGGTASLAHLDQAGRVAMNAAQSLQPDDARVAGVVIDSLDDALDTMTGGDELRAAREVWGRMRRMERVEAVVERSTNAGRGGGGFDGALASGFRNLVNSPRARRGFSEAEIAAMRQVARGGSGAARALTGLGKLLGPSSISGVAGALGAASQVGPAGLLTPAVRWAAQATGNALLRSQGRVLPAMVGASDAQRAAAQAAHVQPNALAAFVPAVPMAGLNALAAFGGPR